MANSDNPKGFSVVKTTHGGPATIMYFPVATTQTLAKGDAVYLSSGQVTIAGGTTNPILGVMAQASVLATANTLVAVYVGCEGNIFEGRCSGDSARSLVGTSVDIEGATGTFQVNENSTGDLVVRIVELNPDDDIGANGRVRFIIARSSFNDYQDAE